MSTSLLLLALLAADPAPRPFAIEVVDDQTGRGVPLVELTTTSGITYVTDSAGLVAFAEPGLMHQRVFFHVKSHGYEAAKDGFGFLGVRLDVEPGGSAIVRIKRLNIAERLYRVTGQGIYRDSVLLGRKAPIAEPLLNAQVAGCDSVVNTVYQGRIHWFWGDTNRVAYPLGLYHVPGATSELPTRGGLDPDRGVNLTYYAGDDGFARATAKMPGEGPTWIWGLATVPDAAGGERMLCGYVKIKQPMTVYRRGIAEWDDEAKEFRQVAEYEPEVPLFPNGQATIHGEGDSKHVYFATPFPLVRTRATAESYKDRETYEAFTCLRTGSTWANPQIDRDEAGRIRYAWRKDTPPVGPQEQAKLIREGQLQPHEGLLQLRDIESGKPVLGHAGSVHWNEHRRRFVMITAQIYGTSMVGETWYAEAEAPVGPWVYARKIVTHDKYSFYNPKQHPMFDKDGGRVIFFEGTYTSMFSGNDVKTPRYDYNQIMYKLDLSEPRLRLPAD
jgi:hypothetical protein